ncbi:hypothetical protein S40285_10212 [Stachybotrys chlorohalonatus IBT 40285]|uniref:Uncharacterized protein n=1 Tax=Stachybotrys chlorohalonatus (strain IBT 40285) TaxID=1283841 RepID=A0A084R1X7_STAC4|nr:hypothetical protein S40285_10212 [Stachybotrys chlorohalonata IBT 40285]
MVTQEKDNTGKVHPINSDDGRRDDCWEVKPMLKSVPKNLWGVYDPSAAPALKGNALGSLLNGPKAKGSVDLDEVPKFNLVEDMRVGVKEFGYTFVGVEETAREQ